jgi:Beta-propeller repeat
MKTSLRAVVYYWVLLVPSFLLAAPNSTHFDRPLVFEPNLGQAPSQVSWTARGQGYQLYLTGSGASIVLAEPVPASAADSSMNPKPGTRLQGLAKARVSVVGMNLGGSHAWSSVEGQEPTGGISNYLVGPQKDWHRGIPQYSRVRVKDVYDGIDLIFYGHGHDMEYDFVVRPGGDPNQIRLAFDGVDSMQVDAKNGDLVIKTKTGSEMRNVQPKVYQQMGDKKVEVAGSYQILAGQAAFRLANYDRRNALVVDPKVEFTTFLEGSGEDYTTGVAVLGVGNTYVVGQTYSTDLPTTTFYAVSKVCPGNICPAYIFVTELDPLGNVLGTTLIGGSNTDTATGIAVNAEGVWVSGTTYSPEFATNTDYARGLWNAFVAKLSLDITKVDWCTSFGGYGDQYTYQSANAIVLDANDNAYVAGDTYSNSFPTSESLITGAHASKQKKFGGTVDAFVAKIGANGKLDSGYSTYLGGASDDEAYGIAVDTSGHAYVTGYTGSENFPVTSAPSHGSLTNGGTLAFITELSKDGSSSLYSVVLGGTKSAQHNYPLDQGAAIVLDSTNEAYVAGTSCTSDFPTNANSFQKTPPSACLPQSGPYDTSAFVAKLSSTGSLLYSTYLGGTGGAVSANAIAIDSSENIYVAGVTSTGVFPGTTPITLNPTAGFLTKFHPKLYTIDSSIFLGASITGIAEFEPTLSIPDPVVVPSIMTTGYRYRPGSPTLASKYLDAFIVDVAYLPTL